MVPLFSITASDFASDSSCIPTMPVCVVPLVPTLISPLLTIFALPCADIATLPVLSMLMVPSLIALLPPLFFAVVICPLMTPVLPLYRVCVFFPVAISASLFTVPQLLKAPAHRPSFISVTTPPSRLLNVPPLSTEPLLMIPALLTVAAPVKFSLSISPPE
ncbi:hypothetical protein NGUA15_00325 [Salmonella enterica]|nr:hypothetical protein NGUA15_00325 [Salmonella enterica]